MPYYSDNCGKWVSTVKIFLSYFKSPIKKLELLAEATSDVLSLNASEKQKFAEVVQEYLLPLLLSTDYQEETNNPINSTTVGMLRQKNVFKILGHVIRWLQDNNLEKYIKAGTTHQEIYFMHSFTLILKREKSNREKHYSQSNEWNGRSSPVVSNLLSNLFEKKRTKK